MYWVAVNGVNRASIASKVARGYVCCVNSVLGS